MIKAIINKSGEHKEGADGYYGYACVEHTELGAFYFSLRMKDNMPIMDGYPWNFLREDAYLLSVEQQNWIKDNADYIKQTLKKGIWSFEI